MIYIMKNRIFIEEKVIIEQPFDLVWNEFKHTFLNSNWNKMLYTQNFPKYVGEVLPVTVIIKKYKIKMKPKIISIHTGYLQWEGKLYINGLFNGKHTFILRKIDEHTTEFRQSEEFKGILIPLFYKTIILPTQNNFKEMNIAFKRYIEEKINAL